MTKNKKFLKRALSLLLAILMVLSLLPMSMFTISAAALEELSATIDTGVTVTIKDSDNDGYYDINNADELYAFAAIINGGSVYKQAELTTNIVVNKGVVTAETSNPRVWIPIGNSTNQFKGKFNGNNYTISGLYCNQSYSGLFGVIEKATVSNLGVINSFITGSTYIGAIAGRANEQSYIIRCYNTSVVTGTSTSVGGILGYGNYCYIKSCYNTGSISGDENVGGIVGFSYGVDLDDCYSIGYVTATYYYSGIIGYVDRSLASVSNCYYLDTSCDSSRYSHLKRTAQQFASGEITYLLGSNFGQIIGAEDFPVIDGCKVYKGYDTCVADAMPIYSNAELSEDLLPHTWNDGVCSVCSVVCEHSEYDNGFCVECDSYEPTTLNADGYYEISNAGQLYWFSEFVNQEDDSASAILTDNIVVNEGVMTADTKGARAWTPIGNNSKIYIGTFEGNNKTISGLYANTTNYYTGLFGYISTGNVQNLGVINSYFKGSRYVGGIAGASCANITNCYNTSIVVGNNYVGGIVGYAYHGRTSDCYNTGDVTGNSYYVGGVAGTNEDYSLITKCYNTGTIKSTSYSVGGVVGANRSSVTNCYNAGSVTGTYDCGMIGSNYNGTISNCYNTGVISGERAIGGVSGGNSGGLTKILNSYYLDTTCIGGVNGENIEGSAEAKTAQQFKSGEVAYLLQGEQEDSIWGQIIDDESNFDSTPVLGGKKVYYGYTSCADKEMFYTNNTDASTELPDHNWVDGTCDVCNKICEHVWDYGVCEICSMNCKHPKCEAEFSWDDYYDGSCYARVDLTCTDCDQYVTSHSDNAVLDNEVAPVDCMHPGSKTFTFTYEYNGEVFSDTNTIEIKSYNHIGEICNGFCSECGGYEVANLNDNETPDNEFDDYYEISNAGQLYWFKDVAVANNNSSNAVLTANIIVNEDIYADNIREWDSIGESSSMPYTGSFDGQGHFISGLYSKSDLNYIGLFGAIGWGASISNLGVKNSYFEGNYYVGGIVGYNDFSYVNNCYADNVEITSNGSGAALVGYNYGDINNSYSTSESFVDKNLGTIANCYYLADEEIDYDDGTTAKSAEAFSSGEVAYLLQSGVVGEEIYDEELDEWVTTEPKEIWGQSIGIDIYPVLGGKKVYEVVNCQSETIYSNDNKITQHNIVDDTCTLCGGVLSDKVEGVTVSDITLDSFTVTFKKLIDAENYWIIVNGVTYDRTHDTSYTVKNRKEGTKYEVMVLASFADKTMTPSPYAQKVSVETLKTHYDTNYSADVSSIKLEWTTNAEKTWIFIGKDAQSLTAYDHTDKNSYEVKNLKSNTEYYVQIKHVFDGKLVNGSDVMKVKTEADSVLDVVSTIENGVLTANWNSIEGSYKYWLVVKVDGRELMYDTTETTYTLSGFDKDCTVTVIAACKLANGNIKMVNYNETVVNA